MPTAEVEIDEAGQWYMSGSAQDFYRNHDLVVAHCEANLLTACEPIPNFAWEKIARDLYLQKRASRLTQFSYRDRHLLT